MKNEQERKQQQARALQERDEKIAAKHKATQFANAFITELKTGRIADAYAMTSAGYRKRATQEQLGEMAREHANTLRAINPFRETVILDQDLVPPFTYSHTKAAQGGFIKVEVVVVKENADWKVDRFYIGMFDRFRR